MFKDILLYLDDSPACETRIDVALALAREHAAVLTGISILTHDYYQPRQQRAEEYLADAGAHFRQKAAAAGVAAVWREVDSPVVGVGVRELLNWNSHCSDLVIVGQEARGEGGASAVVERLVLGAGRPVMIIPAVGTYPTVGRRVLVAWKNGREAARAVSDAMPILRRADKVELLAVTSAEPAGEDPWGGLREHLGRHGVNADAEQLPAISTSLADILLNRACDGGFDLLVMGAFAMSAQGAAQLGPAAAQILREMTLPTLLSH